MSTVAAPRSIERPPARTAAAVEVALTPVRTARATAVIAALLVALGGMLLVSAGAGQLHVPAGEVVGSVLHRIGLPLGDLPSHPNGEAALWNIRFPRLAMGLLVGAALGVAGAVMQGIFGNPLAEPGVIGVSAGAGVGACAVIVFGWAFLGPMTIPAAAFATALVTTIVVYGLARRDGRTEVITLVLMGIAVNLSAGPPGIRAALATVRPISAFPPSSWGRASRPP